MKERLFKLFHPEVFQGSLKKRYYFEGWYFKQVSADFNHVISVIPGISLAGQPHAFIQIINGIDGSTHYIEFHIDDFETQNRSFDIRIGENRFTAEGMSLNIKAPGISLAGTLRFSNQVHWPGSLLAPGVMGWYSYVPRMECYHGIVSMDHHIQGELVYDGQKTDFKDGRGYIEKDWGTSMPESWIWLHANTFETRGTSVMISIAKIPWNKSHFTGFLCFVLHQNKIYRFMTYNSSRIESAAFKEQAFSATLLNKKYRLKIEAIQKKPGKLKAPVKGLMERYIKESVDSSVNLELTNRYGNLIFSGSANRAGLELVGHTEDLLK